MKTFNLGSLADWSLFTAIGAAVPLDCPTPSGRRVHFDLFADSEVRVYVTSDETGERKLVAVSDGLFTCKFTIGSNASFSIEALDGAEIYIRTYDKSMVLPASELASYTTIEPRRTGASDQFRQLMHLVNLQSQQREKMLLAEIRSLRNPAPAPQPSADLQVIDTDDEDSPKAETAPKGRKSGSKAKPAPASANDDGDDE